MTAPAEAHERVLSWRTAIEAAIAAAVTAALALIVFGPIWGSMGSPLGSGDMLATYANADNFAGLGYGVTTQAGFPFGMNLNYSPNLDHTQNAFAKAIDLLTGSPFWGINLLLFVSFPLTAALAAIALRMVSRGGPLAIALACAYALIPFHFGRGLGHTYLATGYSAVTGLILVLAVGLGWLTRESTRGRRLLVWALVAVLVVVTAWSGLYYAAFTLILGAAAVLWRIAKRDRWADVALGAVPFAAIGVLAIIGFLPGLLTTLADPPSAPLADRMPVESVTFAGYLAMALLPAPISQLPGMWRYNEAVYEAIGALQPQYENSALTNFGTWITSACAVVFVLGMVVHARRGRLGATPLPLLGYLTVVTVLFFVPMGLNYLLAGTVTAQVRAWNRLLPVLLLLFMLGAMAALARSRLGRTGVASVVTALTILAVVAVEQVMPFRAAYAQGAAEGSADETAAVAYASAVNAAVPGECGVLQLPYVVYPEQGSIEDLTDYQHFLHALVNPDKDFSYGAVRNTDASAYLATIGNRPSAAALAWLREQGFCAIHVDNRGFTDTAQRWVRMNLSGMFGPPVAVGDAGTWELYDIRPR